MKHTKKEEKEQPLDNISGKEQNLEELYEQLEKSKKGGMSFFKTNSEYYQTVSRRLRNVLESMAIRLTDSTEDIQGTLDLVKDSYENLINACNQYLSRSAKTHHGQARQGIVHNILERAELDMQAFRGYIGEHFLLPENEKAETVGDAIKTIRRKKLFLTKSDDEYEHVGGAASRLTVLKEGDFSNSNDSGYFKEQEEFTLGLSEKEYILNIMENVRKRYPVTDAQYEKVKKVCDESTGESMNDKPFSANIGTFISKARSLPEYSNDEGCFRFIDLVINSVRSMDTIRENINDGGKLNYQGKKGEKFNLSGRNVATSRVAEFLGIGNVVAKSETVEVFEPGMEKGKIGNLMKKAEGRSGEKVTRSLQRELIDAGHESGKGEGANIIKDKVTGNFQRDMSNLQILDYLTGQIDRHWNNYMVQEETKTENGTEKTRLTGLTGIDNDFAFGNAKIKDDGQIGSHGITPVNQKGELIIPHMDKKLAERILSMDKKQLEFLLVDLIEKENIEAACKRLEILQKAIKTANENVFVKDGNWDEKTLKAFWNYDSKDTESGSDVPSYLQEFLRYMEKGKIDEAKNDANIAKQCKEKRNGFLMKAQTLWNERQNMKGISAEKTLGELFLLVLKKIDTSKETYARACISIGGNNRISLAKCDELMDNLGVTDKVAYRVYEELAKLLQKSSQVK